MTWEEAIKILRKQQRFCKVIAEYANETVKADELREAEALDMAISALRPVSREQVEKVWPGCEFCNRADFGEFGFEITKHYAKISCALGSWRFPKGEQFLFCPKCGKPLTDEAVEMVMKRMEALHEITE